MGRTSTWLFALWGLFWLAALTGFVLARAWYADDVCNIAHWKCSLGDIGFAALFWGGLLGIVMLVFALLVLLAEGRFKR